MRLTAWLFGLLLLALGNIAGAETLNYTTYYHNDHLGSPVAATNEQGALLWRAHFRPYGERQEDPKGAAYGGVGYTGHMQDADSGMVYAGARYYDPLIGRFMAIDPVGAVASIPGSFNRYAYVQNNPYRFVDPSGEWLEDAVIGVPSLVLGTRSLGQNVQSGQWSAAAVDLGGIVLDGVAMAIPGVPGGAGLSIQASRKLLSEGVEQVAKRGGTGAESAANGLKLNKSLASDAQMGEAGITMAGPGGRVPFRDSQRIASEHGGDAANWVKQTSSSHTARDGATFETHWVENVQTGQRVEFKTKFPGGD